MRASFFHQRAGIHIFSSMLRSLSFHLLLFLFNDGLNVENTRSTGIFEDAVDPIIIKATKALEHPQAMQKTDGGKLKLTG